MFGNIRLAIGTILENLRNSSESGWKSSENRENCEFYVLVQEQYLTRHIVHATRA